MRSWWWALVVVWGGGARAELLTYHGEWRLMHAGEATLRWEAGMARLTVKTTGVVGALYHVNNEYTVVFDEGLCASSTLMKAEEGSRRLETRVTFDRERGKAELVEHNLKTGEVKRREPIDVPACVHDVVAALGRLRREQPREGAVLEYPISDGKKSIQARIVTQQRENLKTPLGSFAARRYEALLFGGVLYRRKGRLFVWLSEDERRLPLKIRIQLPFYVGTVTLELVKEDRS